MKITNKKIVYKGFNNVIEFTIDDSYKRTLYVKSDDQMNIFDEAVAGMVINQKTKKAYFVSQTRPAKYHLDNPYLIEVVAGNLNKGEDPTEAFIREVYEELRIDSHSKVECFGKKYTSPGRTGEICHFFICEIDQDILHIKGGLEQEHEDIDIVEMDFNELKDFEFDDLKTSFIVNKFKKLYEI